MTSTSSIIRVAALAAFAALLAIAPGLLRPPSTHAALTDSDGDGIADETELLFGSNPHDAASTPEVGGNLAPLIARDPNRCSDGVDNDKDGLVDSADPDCKDSDQDGIPDPVEQALGSDPLDDTSYPENTRFDNFLISSNYPVQLCKDGGDDDKDGLTDAADPGCNPIDSDGDGFDDITEKSLGSDWLDANSVPEHASVNPGSCTDGIDNDRDGLVDSADPGCISMTNDNVADATVVNSLPFDGATKSLGATTETGEQTPGCALDAIEGTVWYSFTSPADTPVVIDTAGSDFATLVGVWTRGKFSYSEVACNNGFLISPSPRFAFQATHGVTYKIQVGRNNILYPGAGRLTIHMEAAVKPANDNFADATDISAIPSTASVDVVAATIEAHEPSSSCAFGPMENTVWYRYTPAKDAYVLADTAGSDLSGNVLSVYQGTALGALTDIACGWPYAANPQAELAFLARAGQTYYLQAGGVGFSIEAPTSQPLTAAALPTSGSHIVVNLHVLDVPSCPAPQFTIPDRVGDQVIDAAQPDILSLSAAFTADRLCLTVQLDRERSLMSWDSVISFDTDQDRSTGYPAHVESNCKRPIGLGVDVEFLVRPSKGLLIPLRSSLNPGDGAIVLVNGASYTITIPLAALGGDDHLSFALDVLGDGLSSDCAPDGGHVTCGGGTCAFTAFRNGDTNCSSRTDSIDAVLVLQYSAGLFSALACPDAADVNGDGRVDSLDASLILQYEAGLIGPLPPPPCRDPRGC